MYFVFGSPLRSCNVTSLYTSAIVGYALVWRISAYRHELAHTHFYLNTKITKKLPLIRSDKKAHKKVAVELKITVV